MDNSSNHVDDCGPVRADESGVVPLARPVGVVPVARAVPGDLPDQPIGNLMRLSWVPAMTCVINLLIAIAGFILLQFAAVAIAMPEVFTSPEAIEESEPDMTIMVPIGIGMVAMIVIMLRLQRIPLRSIGMTARNLAVEVMLGIPTAAVGYGVFILFTILAYFVFPQAYTSIEKNVDNVAEMMPESGLLGLAGIMLCVALYEEVFFRGMVLTHLRRITRSWWVAVFAGSALFAAGHLTQETVITIPLFGLGVVLSAVTIWRRSLVPAMVGHFLFNYGQIVVLTLIPNNPLSDKMNEAIILLVQSRLLC